MSKLKTQFNDLVQAPESPAPLFSEIVNLSVNEAGSPYDFSQYENKTLSLTITGEHSDQLEIIFPNICRIIILPNVGWDGGWIQNVGGGFYYNFFGNIDSPYNVSINNTINGSDASTFNYIKFYNQIIGSAI